MSICLQCRSRVFPQIPEFLLLHMVSRTYEYLFSIRDDPWTSISSPGVTLSRRTPKGPLGPLGQVLLPTTPNLDLCVPAPFLRGPSGDRSLSYLHQVQAPNLPVPLSFSSRVCVRLRPVARPRHPSSLPCAPVPTLL